MIVICIGTAGVVASAFMVSRNRDFLYVFVFFVCYAFDLALIFLYEYFGTNAAFDISNYYNITYPWARIVLGLIALESLWSFTRNYFGEKQKTLVYGPSVIYVILSSIFAFFLSPSPLAQWLFFSTRQVFLFWILGYALWKYLHTIDLIEKTRIERHKNFFIAAVILTVVVLIEDTIVILLIPPHISMKGPISLLYLSERNFSENILAMLLAAVCLRKASHTLRLRFDEPPLLLNSSEGNEQVEELVPVFAKKHNLTARETEILYMVLAGMDNRHIAGDLKVALGTVKTHVHNILKKTESANRQELAQRFWRE